MHTYQYRFHFVLAVAGVLLAGQSAACEPPPGFVNPPRPEIAPLEDLLSHTEVKEIARPLSAVMQAANRPLRIDATKDLAGVTGTFRLSNGPYGTVGARRLVCKTDGTIAVEEVLLTESNGDGSRFRYVVWNHTGAKYRDVDYAVGEFVRSQPEPGKTLVNWTYRFALKSGLSEEERSRFQKVFLERELSLWMRTQLDRDEPNAEAKP
ncbi:MAG TPA: hypothetical protein VEW08_07050 [Steroidobacteraceae bacterium]|nr:hypothetical protein [Steroidobacteraceae bacterium]